MFRSPVLFPSVGPLGLRDPMTIPLPPRSSPHATTAEAPPARDAFHSSGQSPGRGPRPAAPVKTLHLLGPGLVGRALLPKLAALPVRVIAISDSTATVFDRDGLPLSALLAHKQAGSALSTWPAAEAIPTELAIRIVGADLVVDATPTRQGDTDAAVRRGQAALQNGAFLALCGKNAVAARPDWLHGELRGRVGVHGVFGGAGQALVRELPELRAHCRGLALVGNVTTTVLIEAIERGASLAEGIAVAQARGLLEPDPTLDLDGSDAATKLLAVWGAVFGAVGQPLPSWSQIVRADIRSLAVDVVRERFARAATTRLVGRGSRTGLDLSVGFEELPLGSPLAAPPDRVVYGYDLPAGLRVHTGLAVGHERTADALLADLVQALAAAVR